MLKENQLIGKFRLIRSIDDKTVKRNFAKNCKKLFKMFFGIIEDEDELVQRLIMNKGWIKYGCSDYLFSELNLYSILNLESKLNNTSKTIEYKEKKGISIRSKLLDLLFKD